MDTKHLITFKAGRFTSQQADTAAKRTLSPDPTPGYIILYEEDEMVHFSWCKRTNLSGEADLDLVIINDARFVPYTKTKHRGRIFALKFTSSNSRHFFWLQSGPQTRDGDASYLSDRDKKIGDAVDRLCRGEEIEIEEEVDQIRAHNGQDGDDDTMMEDADHESGPAEHLPPYSAAPQDHSTREAPGNHGAGGGSGGQANAGATPNVQEIMQNFLDSMKDSPNFGASGQEPYTTLPDLLPPSTTLPTVQKLPVEQIDALLRQLSPKLLLHAVEGSTEEFIKETSEEDALGLLEVLDLKQKQEILRKVLQSPQFSQSLASLTVALRDGGLPSISEALGIKLKDGGYIGNSANGIAKGGSAAVRAFVEGFDVGDEVASSSDQAKETEMDEI